MSKCKRVVLMFDQDDPDCVSRTKQSFTEDADINNVLRKYMKTGVLSTGLVSQRHGAFADVSSGDDYRDILDKVRLADQAFEGLDSEVRSRFDNDVSKLLDFLTDPANCEEAVKLGLLPSDSVTSPVAVEGEEERPAVPAATPATPPVGGDSVPPEGDSA